MNKSDIEYAARSLQHDIWRAQARFWPSGAPNPIGMLDPVAAARILGIDFELCEELGRFGDGNDRFETAGMLNRQAGKIAVSRRFPLETIRFTGAHEIGHWLLHPDNVMHRDRPIRGLANETYSRPPQEKEADYFAACFLMPRKLLTAVFKQFFHKIPFIFNDTTSFWLCQSEPESLLRADEGSLEQALSIASAENFEGKHFNSLSKQFGVSASTMAIRIKELDLIRK